MSPLTRQHFMFCLIAAFGGACSSDPPHERGVVGTYPSPAVDAASAAPKTARTDNVPTATEPTPAEPKAAAPPPVVIDKTGSDNPAGLSADEVRALKAGGPPGAMKWLYPYEGTVFPTGMHAPYVMWEGEIPDAVYVRLKSKSFDYAVVVEPAIQSGLQTASWGLDPMQAMQFGLPVKPQVQFPQDIWELACRETQGKSDPFTLELTARVQGKIAGPIAVHFTIAQGGVKGSIYYTAYGSMVPPVSFYGKLLRLRDGKAAELAVASEVFCSGCHSVSANGTRVIWQNTQNWFDGQGLAAQLDSASSAALPQGVPTGPRAAFGALYPDGSKYLSTSLQIPVSLANLVQRANAPIESLLYDTTTGQTVPDTGIPTTALMPMFAPDGRKLVFNDHRIDAAHGLAVMDYDTSSHKASAYQVVMKEANPSDVHRPAWPSFLPDAQAIVFARTNGADFTAGALGGTATVGTGQTVMVDLSGLLSTSELYIVDLVSRKPTLLAKAMGFDSAADATDERTYLPFGAADLHLNYAPTVSPVAAGGYYWVFFDSIRNFGNLGRHRQLWGTAIDIRPDGNYALDPSHPPFYLAGQELSGDNHRAFAALDACRPEGEPCRNGIDCCTGFCSDTCTPPPNRCAGLDEHCAATADCCDPSHYCINGFCALVELL